MERKKHIASVVIGAFLFLAGIFLIMNAVNMGMGAADRAIRANGGSMDTDKYYFIMKSSAVSYQIAGAISSLTGGIGLVFLECGKKRGDG